MIATLKAALEAAAALCNAYVAREKRLEREEIDLLEDELEELARDQALHPTADRNLRIRLLRRRKERKEQRLGPL